LREKADRDIDKKFEAVIEALNETRLFLRKKNMSNFKEIRDSISQDVEINLVTYKNTLSDRSNNLSVKSMDETLEILKEHTQT
jgi:DNA-binding transcriptional regulator GbsR (MarR family)